MKKLKLETWNRKEHFKFFSQFHDPYFAITVHLDVSKAFTYSKANNYPFFALYLYACMKAINSVENFKFRIVDNEVIIHDTIHASATFLRENKTFGFSFIHFDPDFKKFYANYKAEKHRILNSNDLFPPIDSEACIYCSAMPWLSFTGHKEPLFGSKKESVPKLAFGKCVKENGTLKMPVSIAVNHALVDGYHMSLFVDQFQKELANF